VVLLAVGLMLGMAFSLAKGAAKPMLLRKV
jgi:hypothetical protein